MSAETECRLIRMSEPHQGAIEGLGQSLTKAAARLRLILGAALCLSMNVPATAEGTQDHSKVEGLVVEDVSAGSALQEAGLRPGDVVLSWQRLPHPPANRESAQGELRSVFDWRWLQLEQAPRGTVELSGRRDGGPLVFRVEPGNWQAEVRPWMEDQVLDVYLRGRKHLEDQNPAKAEDLWTKLAQDGDWHLRCFLWLELANAWAENRQWERAVEVYHSAIEAAAEPFAKSVLTRAVGNLYRRKQEFELARQALESMRDLRKLSSGDSLALAEAVTDLGIWSAERGQLNEAQELYSHALEIHKRLAPGSLNMAHSLNNLAVVAFKRGNLKAAVELHEQALAIRQQRAPESLESSASFNNLGLALTRLGKLEKAKMMYERALEIRRRMAPESNLVGESLNNLGILEKDLGNLERAEELYETALLIHQKHDPRGEKEANTLNNLGLLASDRGQPAEAKEFHQRALRIRGLIAPDSLAVAASLNNLGIVSYQMGDLEDATSYFERALSIQQELAPESLEVARSLGNLSFLLMRRGHLDQARKRLERALRIHQEEAPNSLTMARMLDNLASLFSYQGDTERAARHYEQALEIMHKTAPESPDMAHLLKNIGAASGKAGDPDRAATHFERALEILLAAAPESSSTKLTLLNLGVAKQELKHFGEAESYFRRALEIQQKQSLDDLEMADILSNMASLKFETGKPEEASELFARALSIFETLAPESLATAQTLYALGTCELHRAPPRKAAAKGFFERALQVLGRQLGRLGGSHAVRAGFHAQHRKIYLGAIKVNLELQQPEHAFLILEHYRARIFLEQLAERDTVFAADVPEQLDRARRILAVRYDRTQRKIAQLGPRGPRRQVETLNEELSQMRDETRDIEERIRSASPKLASLQYPKPLDLPETRGSLDPGTLMLSYLVGDSSSYLFVVSKDHPLEVHELAVGESELRRRVEDLLVKTHSHGWKRRAAGRLEASRLLYETLIEPAEAAIERSERLLIMEDGPLHLLPFASLVGNSADDDRPWRYLVEWKPIHSVLSATVYAELRKTRRAPSPAAETPARLVAFGDPQYPRELQQSPGQAASGLVADVSVRSAVERGSAFPPLPYSRLEVAKIASHFPDPQLYLGAEATEERATSIDQGARIVHFATHGTLDHRFPLNSAVALSIPARLEVESNGLLQAWEILERVRLDADLVVLSACESGLGEELGGEGLIGLTRAFQFAGARSVAATLWKVPDSPVTAFLMERFYRHLKAGLGKDEALRAAQRELIAGPIRVQELDGGVTTRAASAPYYWAAFRLTGDWR